MNLAFYTTRADPSDSWSNHWMNAPEQEPEEQECPNCFKQGFLSEVKYNGRWLTYCQHCEKETFEFINKHKK